MIEESTQTSGTLIQERCFETAMAYSGASQALGIKTPWIDWKNFYAINGILEDNLVFGHSFYQKTLIFTSISEER